MNTDETKKLWSTSIISKYPIIIDQNKKKTLTNMDQL